MVLGTHSSSGKSAMATAFCRLLSRRGYAVAPFKAQNMSNNAGVARDGGEMGRSQIAQAEAAGIAAHTDMNPVLLKPEAGMRSQLILNGRVHGYMQASNWRDLKRLLWDEVRAAYDRLASRFDVVVLEGAGSPAEINLKEADIVNLRMAAHAEAPCLLVGDIDRGGVFAALAGTMHLLEPGEREQIKGFIINKFRGDPALLGNGLEELQRKAFGVPTLGVVPYLPDLRLPAEDAVEIERIQPGDETPRIDIAVIALPHISNFDDFEPLAGEAAVGVRYVATARELGQPHAVILPGTKVTLHDLQWLRSQGLDQAIGGARRAGAAVVGICGGYQMMGSSLADPLGVETTASTRVDGLGLLPVETTFERDKNTHQVRLDLGDGEEELSGYEIHLGHTRLAGGATPFGTITRRGDAQVRLSDGAVAEDGKVWGSYVHGLFANDAFRRRWLAGLGWQESGSAPGEQMDFDRLADAVESAVQWSDLERIIGL